jgi:hypothetical protein
MKKVKLCLAMCLIFACSFTIQAQKVKVVSGDVKALKGEKILQLNYNYESMTVGRFKTEAEYTNKKVEEYNKKEAGKGDKWLVTWNEDKAKRFQPAFEEHLNNALEKSSVIAGANKKDAKYTLTLKTVFFEPGFNVGIERRSASINVEVIITETKNPSAEVAKLFIKNIPGGGAMGFDFDSGYRVQKAYETAGTVIGKYLSKNAFK